MTRTLVLLVVCAAASGCGDSDTAPQTVGTAIAPTTTTVTVVTTTADPHAGPVPLETSKFLEPGEYVTNTFEPTMLIRLERKHLLQFFERSYVLAFQKPGVADRGIMFHGVWRNDAPEEVLAEVFAPPVFELGEPVPIEIGGVEGFVVEGTVTEHRVLWHKGDLDSDVFPGRWRGIFLDTVAGTVVIEPFAPEEEYDEFLAVVEEILSGVTFVDVAP